MAFRWSQNTSSVTITFPVPAPTKKTDVDVSVVNTSLRAGVKGSVPLCEGTLTSPVKGFKWSLKANTVSIQLEKTVKVKWNDLLVPGRCKALVLFDYQSRDPVELTVYKGDIITVLNEDNSGWWKGDLNGKIGLFPSNFTEIIEAQPVPEGPEEPEPVAAPPPVAQAPPPVAQAPIYQPPPVAEMPAAAPPPGPARVPLIASNGAMMELRNKLATRANTVVSLEEAEKANSSREPPQQAPPVARPPPKAEPAPVPAPKASKPGFLATARALYDYAAVEEGELTFAEGSRVDILLRDDSGWWQGQCGDAVGWFPAEYVSEVKDVLPPVPPIPASAQPAPAPTPAAAQPTDASGSNEDEVEDDVIDISGGSNRLVVPRRPMGASVRRMPSKATLQRNTAKALQNTSSSDLLATPDGEATPTPTPAPTPAPVTAPLSPTPVALKPRPPPPGSKKPPPPKALPASPADSSTVSPTPTPTPTPPAVRATQPTAVPRAPSPTEDANHAESASSGEDPSPPKAAVIKRPPPPGAGRGKMIGKKPPAAATAPAPAAPDASEASSSPPAATPTHPVPSKLVQRPPPSSSTSAESTPEKVPPSQTPSSSSLSNSSGSVPPPAATPTAPASVTPRKIVKPPPPTNFTKQLSSTDTTAVAAASTPAPTPPPAATTPTLPPVASPPPNTTPPPTHAVNALNISSNNLLNTSSSWPPHLGTFQDFCAQLTTLLAEDYTDITKSGNVAQLSPRTRMRASVGVCSVDGHVFVHGGGGEWGSRYFALGNASLPFAYCAAVEAVGLPGVKTVVSKDGPRADTFAEIPHPFSTAGSIALCGKLVAANLNSSPVPSAVPSSKLLTLLSSLAGHHLSTNITSFLTQRATSHGDTAIAHFLKAKGHLDASVNPTDALDVHLALKSTEVDVRNGALLAASLAAHGMCPTSRQHLIPTDTATSVVSMLPKITLGGDDDAGIPGWVLDNAVVLVVPNVLGMVVHADDSGRALLVARVLAEKLKMIQ